MTEARRFRDVVLLAAALVLINLVLIQPNHPGAATLGALSRFPLELPIVVILLVLAPAAARAPLRMLVTGALTLLALVKLADLAAYSAYDRPFNPVLDRHLFPASWRLLSGAIGIPLALAAAAAMAAAAGGLAAAAWSATGRIARVSPGPRAKAGLAALALPALALLAIDVDREGQPFDPPGTTFTSRIAWQHLREGWRAGADGPRFRAEAARDDFAALPPEQLMPVLRGTDVLLVFVESYGRSALENPLYAPTIRATLAATQGRLAAAGLAARSGWLTSPVIGGQSWLAHASLLSGLRIDGQGRYAALVAGRRRTLLHLAQAAGWRTAAVVPAITLDWPEADAFGYQTVLTADDLGYRGPPFNWVTMPDQFSLAALERALLGAKPRQAVFAEVALISSHAPWTPIPPLLPWEDLGDGRVYAPHATVGDPPEVVWSDLARVRDQFRLALDYTLRVVGGFAERRAGHPTLIVVLGDHQPVPFVSGGVGGADVPVHVIGDPGTLAHLAEWNWNAGLIPAPETPAWPMQDFRDRFLATFADRGAQADSSVLRGTLR